MTAPITNETEQITSQVPDKVFEVPDKVAEQVPVKVPEVSEVSDAPQAAEKAAENVPETIAAPVEDTTTKVESAANPTINVEGAEAKEKVAGAGEPVEAKAEEVSAPAKDEVKEAGEAEGAASKKQNKYVAKVRGYIGSCF